MGPTGLSTAFKVSAMVCSLEMYNSYFCDTSNPQVFAMVAVFLARWGRPLASSLGPTGNPLKGLWAGTNVPGTKVGKLPLYMKLALRSKTNYGYILWTCGCVKVKLLSVGSQCKYQISR